MVVSRCCYCRDVTSFAWTNFHAKCFGLSNEISVIFNMGMRFLLLAFFKTFIRFRTNKLHSIFHSIVHTKSGQYHLRVDPKYVSFVLEHVTLHAGTDPVRYVN